MSTSFEARDASATSLTELLLMRQGAEYFALVLTAAMEALELPVLTPIPEAPQYLLGMLTDRGAGIPVFAGGSILEVDGLAAGNEVLVIVRDGERLVGLVVDEVEDVIMADVTTMQQPMDAMRCGGVVRGVVHSGNRIVAVLDARALVRMGARALPEIA
jgi:purine-binding chemotaxis protein CheW